MAKGAGKNKKEDRRKTVVVISGPPGAGSTSVAKEVAKRLRLKYFVLGKREKKLGKSKKESKAALEAWKTKEGSSKKFHNESDRLQVEEAKKGNIVIYSKLGIHFLKDLSDYKVWLDVPLRVRAERAAGRDKINMKRAMEEIRERERIEREQWKRIYGFDYFYQKKIADFVLDSSNLTLKQTVDKIIKFIKSSQ